MRRRYDLFCYKAVQVWRREREKEIKERKGGRETEKQRANSYTSSLPPPWERIFHSPLAPVTVLR